MPPSKPPRNNAGQQLSAEVPFALHNNLERVDELAQLARLQQECGVGRMATFFLSAGERLVDEQSSRPHGRFQRWNSWDLFINPIALLADIYDVVMYPHNNKQAIAFAALWGGFLVAAYLAFYALTVLHRTPPATAAAQPEQTSLLTSGK